MYDIIQENVLHISVYNQDNVNKIFVVVVDHPNIPWNLYINSPEKRTFQRGSHIKGIKSHKNWIGQIWCKYGKLQRHFLSCYLGYKWPGLIFVDMGWKDPSTWVFF